MSKQAAVEFNPITQRQLEKFSEALPKAEDVSLIKYRGDLVRAAASAGWLANSHAELKAEQVDDMDPREVIKIADAVMKKVSELTAIDPN